MAAAGLIEYAEYQPDSFTLLEPVKKLIIKEEHLKTITKTVESEKTILNGLIYTADWKIKFSERAMKSGLARDVSDFLWSGPNKHLFTITDGWWWIDVKGGGSRFNDAKYYSAIRKLMFDKTGVFVDTIKITNTKPKKRSRSNGFFDKTFTPRRFLVCDKDIGRARVIHYPIKTIEQFITGYNI